MATVVSGGAAGSLASAEISQVLKCQAALLTGLFWRCAQALCSS